VCTNGLFAQTENESYDDSSDISGYIAPTFETANAVKNLSFVGATGGFYVTNNIIIGGFGKIMPTYFHIDSIRKGDSLWKNLELDMGGGGIVVGYVLFPQFKIHPIFMAWSGFGSVTVSEKVLKNNQTWKKHINSLYDGFFILNYSAELDYRPLKFLSIGIGAHYQTIYGFNLNSFNNNDLNGFGLYFNLKVGVF